MVFTTYLDPPSIHEKTQWYFLCLFLGIWGVCKPIASFNRMFPGYEGLDWDCYCSLHHVVFTSGHKCEYGTFGICLFVSQRRRCPKHSTEKKATTFKFQCGARNMSTIWVGTITSRGMQLPHRNNTLRFFWDDTHEWLPYICFSWSEAASCSAMPSHPLI